MPGAGKSLASGVAKSIGLRVFVSGDIIRAEAKKRALKPSKENLGRLMLALRREEGMGAVAKRLVPILELRKDRLVVYEGARNVEELDELRKRYRVIIGAVPASQKSRLDPPLRGK